MKGNPNIVVRRIGSSWYEYKHRYTGDRMGVRCHSRGRWGVYFRDKDGKCIKGFVPGEEMPVDSRDQAERLALGELTEA